MEHSHNSLVPVKKMKERWEKSNVLCPVPNDNNKETGDYLFFHLIYAVWWATFQKNLATLI